MTGVTGRMPKKQLSEALFLYDYLTDQANMDYLLNKSSLISYPRLEKQTALDFIAKSPLKEADKQVLIHSLSEFEFRQFGETWRAKHDLTWSLTDRQRQIRYQRILLKMKPLFWLDTWRQARRHWTPERLSF